MNPFWNRGIKCERLVKYDGKNIQIPGVDLGAIKIGQTGIESNVLQQATQAIMLLDLSQFSLCQSIKNITNPQDRDRYVKIMIEDKRRLQEIINSLAALCIAPESSEIRKTVELLLVLVYLIIYLQIVMILKTSLKKINYLLLTA